MTSTYYGKVTYTDGLSHNWFGAKLVLRDEPIAGQNASTVYWDYYVWMMSANLTPYKYKYGNKVTFTLDEKSIVNTANYGTHDPTGHVGEANALLYASGSTTVQHNEDGTKSFAFNFTYEQTQNSTLDKVVVTGTHECTTIIRSSILGAENGMLGYEQTISITRQTSGLKDTVRYTIGNNLQKGIIAEKTTDTTVKWTPSAEIARLDIETDTFPCTYTVETYNGDTLIGTSTKTINLTIYPNVNIIVPDGAIQVLAINAAPALAGFTGIVQNISMATVRVDETVQGDEYGAEVSFASIEYNGFGSGSNGLPAYHNITRDELKYSGTQYAVVSIKNSRGRSITKRVPFEVLPYTPPYISNLNAQRCNVSGEIMPNGRYVYISGQPVVSAYGTNAATVTYDLQMVSEETATAASTTITLPFVAGEGAVDPKYSYLLTVTVQDSFFNSQPYTLNIPDESIPLYIKPNGKAMGLGAYALDDGTLNIGYEILQNGLPFSGGGIQTGTVTIGSNTSTCYYIKTASCAVVFVSTGYLTAAGASAITLPTELQGFKSGAQGAGVVWATGSFSANVSLSPNVNTKNSVNIVRSGMTAISIGAGNMLMGYFILNYT